MFTEGFFDVSQNRLAISMNPTASRDLDAVQNCINQAFDDIPDFSTIEPEGSAVSGSNRLRTSIPSRVSIEQARLGLELISAELREAPLVVTVISLCMRLDVPHPVDAPKTKVYLFPCEDFPFSQQSPSGYHLRRS
jgi:hypothetical protein